MPVKPILRRRRSIDPFHLTPERVVQESMEYMSGRKRVSFPYTIVALCKFGRWLSWALCPWVRFFPRLTDPVDGHISLEHRAQYTLMAPVNETLMLLGMALPVIPTVLFSMRRGRL